MAPGRAGGPPTGNQVGPPGAHQSHAEKTTHFHPLSLLDGRGVKATGRSGRILDRAAPAPVVVNQTKLAIVAVIQELDCPITSTELQVIWAEHKDLKIFEYHLSTLVTAGIAEVAYGPELHFRLVSEPEVAEPSFRERCR